MEGNEVCGTVGSVAFVVDAVTVALGVPDKVTDPVGRLVVMSVPLVVLTGVVGSPVMTGMDEFDDVIGVSVGLVTGGLVVIGPVVVSVGVGSVVIGTEVEESVGVGGIVVTSVGAEVTSVIVGVDESGIVVLSVGSGTMVGSGVGVTGSMVVVAEPKSLVAGSRILERIPPRSVVGADVTVGSAEDEMIGVIVDPVPSGVVVGAVPVPRSEVGSIRVVVGSTSEVVVGALPVPRREDKSIRGVVVGSASDVVVGSAVVVGADDSSEVVESVAGSDVELGIKTELRTDPREGKIPAGVVVGAEVSSVVVGAELSTPVDPADPEKDTPSLVLSLSLSEVGVGVADVVPSVKIPPGPNVIPSADVVVVDSVVSDSDESLDGLGVGRMTTSGVDPVGAGSKALVMNPKNPPELVVGSGVEVSVGPVDSSELELDDDVG